MAGSATNRDDYVALLVPWRVDNDDLDAAVSSYSQDGPQPGVASSTSSPSLQVLVEGDQASDFVVTTQRGGAVKTGGAAFVWRLSTDAAGTERGWDAPNLLVSHSFIEHTSGVATLATDPDAAALPTGEVLVVANYRASTVYSVRAYLIDTGSVTESGVTSNSFTAPSSLIDSSYHPTICVLDDGSVICAYLVEDSTAEEAQVNVRRSTDKGATWTEVAQFALPAEIDTNTTDGLLIQRMRMRQDGGRVILMIWANNLAAAATAYPDGYFQFASDSEGLQFDLVEFATDPSTSLTYNGEAQVDLAAPFGYPDVTTQDGDIFVAWIAGTDTAKLRHLSSPYEAISGSAGTDVVASASGPTLSTIDGNANFTDGECAATTDPDGSIYISFREISDDSCLITRTPDKGASWDLLGAGISSSSNAWYPAEDSYPTGYCMVAARGLIYVYSNHSAPTTTSYENSLSEWGLGGWSSVTFPGNTTFGKITSRATWGVAYFPAELPGNLGTWTKTASGTATESVATGQLVLTSTSSTMYYDATTPTGTAAEGMIVECAINHVSGGATTSLVSGVAARIEDVTDGYAWSIRVGDTMSDTFDLYDDITAASVSGGAVATTWPESTIEFRVEQRGADIQAWYRAYSVFTDRKWTDWFTSTLTSTGGSGGPTEYLRFGCAHTSATMATNFIHVRYASDEGAGQRALAFTTPDDLNARDYSGLGRSVVLQGNTRIYAVGGPGRRNDEYTVARRYDYPIERLHWTNSLTPREVWRSVDSESGASPPVTTIQCIGWQISDLSGDDTRNSPVFGLFLAGIKAWRTGKIITHDTSGTTNYSFSVDHGSSFTFTRTGNTVIPTNAATSGVFLQRHEARGWWVHLDDGAGNTDWVEIKRNTEGVIAGGAGMPTRLTLRDVPSGCPATGTCYLVPDQALVVIHLPTTTSDFELVELQIDPQETDDRRAQLGCAWPGDVVILGHPWENGSRWATVGGAELSESAGRVHSTVDLAPPRREFEVGWTGLHHVGPTAGSASDPNYALASAHASAVPASIVDAIPFSTEGMHRHQNGSERPVVVVPRFDRQGSGSQQRTITGRYRIIPALCTGNHTIRHVQGLTDDSNHSVRGESLSFVELV